MSMEFPQKTENEFGNMNGGLSSPPPNKKVV